MRRCEVVTGALDAASSPSIDPRHSASTSMLGSGVDPLEVGHEGASRLMADSLSPRQPGLRTVKSLQTAMVRQTFRGLHWWAYSAERVAWRRISPTYGHWLTG